jgi:hypothetical protein
MVLAPISSPRMQAASRRSAPYWRAQAQDTDAGPEALLGVRPALEDQIGQQRYVTCGDLIIVDDPIKPTDAMSQKARRTAIEWFNTTVSTLRQALRVRPSVSAWSPAFVTIAWRAR